MQVETGAMVETLSQETVRTTKAPRLPWIRSLGYLVRRGLIGAIGTVFFLNGILNGVLALLAVAVVWDNWLQFHPEIAVALALAALVILLLFPDRQPPTEQLRAIRKAPEEELSGGYRITLARPGVKIRWD